MRVGNDRVDRNLRGLTFGKGSESFRYNRGDRYRSNRRRRKLGLHGQFGNGDQATEPPTETRLGFGLDLRHAETPFSKATRRDTAGFCSTWNASEPIIATGICKSGAEWILGDE